MSQECIQILTIKLLPKNEDKPKYVTRITVDDINTWRVFCNMCDGEYEVCGNGKNLEEAVADLRKQLNNHDWDLSEEERERWG